MIKKFFVSIFTVMILTAATVFAAESNDETYKYISINYGYSIQCPKTPKVVPAEIFFDDNTKKGDVLVFDLEISEDGIYDVKRGWIILVDAFNTNAVPNFNQDSKGIIEQYLEKLQKNGYEGTTLVDIAKGNKGVLAITAKEIEIDTDDDGKPDDMLITDRQDAIAFFRATDGRCFSVQLTGSNGINDAAMSNFRKALSTFSVTDLTNKADNSNDNKNDKKSKKDKKSKSEKKSKK